MNHKLINNTATMLADSTYEMGFVSRAIVKREFRENIQTLYQEKYPNVIDILFTFDIRVCFTNCRNHREHCPLDKFDIYFSTPEVKMTQLINCNLTQHTMSMLHKSLHEENMNIQNDLRMKIKNDLNRIINMYYKTKHSSIISTYYDYDRIRVSYINRSGSLCESYLDTVIVENIRTI